MSAGDAIARARRPRYRRRPATGATQRARQAWGQTWGAISHELAQRRKRGDK